MTSEKIRKLVLSALFIALGMVLPFLTGQIPEIGSMLSPLHIPALLCGFVCGWQWGLVTGFIIPLLRAVTFGMPPLFPTATAMAFELAAYGLFGGLLYARLPKTPAMLYLALAGAMLAGRVVWGLVCIPIYALNGGAFSVAMFTAGAFVKAWPGMILHILVVPPIVLALRKAHLISDKAEA